jgi:hypothetical protein
MCPALRLIPTLSLSSFPCWAAEVAALALDGHPQPLSLSVAPAAVAAARGQRHARETIVITNTGSHRLRIVTSTRIVHQVSGSCVPDSSPHWARVTPAQFTLAPGHHARARFTINAPASVHGQTGVAAEFTAAIPRASGQATVAGEIGSQVILRLPGKPAEQPCHAAIPVTQQSVTGPPAAAGILFALALVVLAVLATMALRRRLRARKRAPRARHAGRQPGATPGEVRRAIRTARKLEAGK